MRLFVALCLAWLATFTPRASDGLVARPGEVPASIRAVASREASPLLLAHGPQVATAMVRRAPAPQHAPPPHETPWAPVVPMGRHTTHAPAALAVSHRVAALGAVAPHFATAPPTPA
jgi:hypothetical protein